MLNKNGAEEVPTHQDLQELLSAFPYREAHRKSRDMRSKELKDFRYDQNLKNTGII